MENKYSYLLNILDENVYDLQEEIYKITGLYNALTKNEKDSFFYVMKQIIQRADFRSYSSVNLLRDIMTAEMYDFLFTELKKDVFINVPLSLEIMKLIDSPNSEYCAFLETIENNLKIPSDFRKFIHSVVLFHRGEINTLTFPMDVPKKSEQYEIEIIW